MAPAAAQIAHRLGTYLPCNEESIFSVLARGEPSGAGSTIGARRLGEALLHAELISHDDLRRGITAQRLDRLAACPLFENFSRAELERLAPAFTEVSVAAGETVIRQGDVADDLYVVASGRLEVFREQAIGGELALAEISAGEPVGEIGYLLGGARSASVRAAQRCELLRSSYDAIRPLIDAFPRLSHAFLAIAVRRLLDTTERFEAEHHQLLDAEKSLARLSKYLDLSATREFGLGIESLLERLVEAASELIGADRASLFLLDRNTGELWSKIAQGSTLREIRVPAGHGVAGWVAQHKQVVNLEDVYLDERFHQDVDRKTGYRTRTMLCAPIWSLAGDILGVVQVVNKKKGRFDHSDQTLILAFAHQAAIAVENFRLYQGMMRSQQRMAMMLELANALGDTLDLETLVQRVVERVTDALDCDRGAFFVVDEDSAELWSMQWTGDEIKSIRIPRDSGLVGHAATHAEVVNIADAYADARFNASVDRATGYRTSSVLCVPVVNIDGMVTGVAQCINKRDGAFDEEDENLLKAICAQVSVALDNAKLHARTVEMSRYLENVHGSIASAIITLDMQAGVVTTNRAARSLLPELCAPAEAVDFEQLLGFRNWPLRNLVTRAYGTGKPVSESDMALFRGADEQRVINANVLPLADGDGAATGLVVLIEDVTNEQRIKTAFSHYLAPAVIEQLLEDPSRLSLGGEKRNVTVLFTDIADFTTLSESIDPIDLVTLLHEYFDETCAVVFRYGGTIDKIVGDSLHVLFNAPLDQVDHHTLAVRCGLELRTRTRALNARGGGKPVLGETRIGVNTGDCVVGNFGGSGRFDYTAHGDAINTAARLEGANKHLGTHMCVSASTKQACEGVEFRPIGSIHLQGKQQAIDVFEPLLPEEAGSARVTDYLEAYALMAAGHADAAAAFAALLKAYPHDGLAALHARRLAAGQSGTSIRLDAK